MSPAEIKYQIFKKFGDMDAKIGSEDGCWKSIHIERNLRTKLFRTQNFKGNHDFSMDFLKSTPKNDGHL